MWHITLIHLCIMIATKAIFLILHHYREYYWLYSLYCALDQYSLFSAYYPLLTWGLEIIPHLLLWEGKNSTPHSLQINLLKIFWNKLCEATMITFEVRKYYSILLTLGVRRSLRHGCYQINSLSNLSLIKPTI